jgi:twitching motility two-component system response regulator PilH
LARKILLADDSVTAQNMGRRILTDAGYDVVTVNNGSAALKKISEQKPDLIVLDIYMPGYGGLEVCQRIKENEGTARIPVLLTVGKLEPFKPDEARRVRADAYVVKPFEASELLAALAKLEDKIVPQGEPRKSSRTKATAPVETESSAKGDRFGDAETGWKNRLKIPSAEQAQPEAEKSGLGGAWERQAPSTKGSKAPPVSLASAAAMLPPDITPDEIAALAAAAEAVQTQPDGGVTTKQPAARLADVPAIPEAAVIAPGVSEPSPAQQAEGKSYADLRQLAPEPPATVTPTAGAAPDSTADSEVVAALASLIPTDIGSDNGRTAVAAPAVPANAVAHSDAAALAAASGPRWTVTEIAASGIESAIDLKKEMESVYLASVADADRQVTHPAEERQESITDADAPAAQPIPESAPVVAESVSLAVAASDVEAPAPVQELAAPIESVAATAVEAPPQPAADTAGEAAVAETIQESAPVVTQGAAFAAAASASTATVETAVPVAAQTSTAVPPEAPVPAPKAPARPGVEEHRNAETAAAWEHWQKVRDSVMGSQLAVHLTESAVADLREPHTDAQDGDGIDAEPIASTQPSPANPTAIASIVDSVLAELKPKLVEEITRKLEREKRKE